ncbi:MAG: tetratricopeptide repeat protein [Lentisphaerae bacterium]|nr:tetratricopeptide repeat protein [Lentisphaerota bacterium]
MRSTWFLMPLLLFCAAAATAGTGAAAGWEALGYMDFKDARDAFETARGEAAPGSQAWREATLGLAFSLHQRQPDERGDKERAGQLFGELTDAVPETRAAAFALLMLGRLADLVDYVGDTPDHAAARGYYNRLIEAFPELPLIHLAALYRAEAGITTMQPATVRDAVTELRAWLDAYPDNPFAAHHWMLIGHALRYPLEDPAAAADAFVQAARAGLPPNTKLDAFYWRLANLAEQGGQAALAMRYYTRIIQEVQRTPFAYESQERIRALGGEPPDLIDPFAPGAEP